MLDFSKYGHLWSILLNCIYYHPRGNYYLTGTFSNLVSSFGISENNLESKTLPGKYFFENF